MADFQITQRSDGLTVITAEIPAAQTVTHSLMFRAGSRYENPQRWGLAHFFEHMLFKGTKNYPDPQSLASDIDALGGIQNAYTWNEVISVWIKGARTHLDKIFEINAEKVIHPLFPEREVPKELKVVIEEYRMNYDDPGWVEREWERELLCGQRGTLDALGEEETIREFTHADVLAHFQTFSAPNGVSVLAGGVTHAEHLALAEKYLQFKNLAKPPVVPPVDFQKLGTEKVVLVERPQFTQANVTLGTAICGLDSSELPAFRMLGTVLSGGMSTRLFQELREKNSLCYTVGAGGVHFSDFGVWSIDGGMNIDNVEKSVELMLTELRKLREELVTPAELAKAKSSAKGRLAIASENTQFICDAYARRFLATGQIETITDTIAANEQVTAEQIQTVAQKYFAPERLRLGVIGPFSSAKKAALEKLL